MSYSENSKLPDGHDDQVNADEPRRDKDASKLSGTRGERMPRTAVSPQGQEVDESDLDPALRHRGLKDPLLTDDVRDTAGAQSGGTHDERIKHAEQGQSFAGESITKTPKTPPGAPVESNKKQR
ncbi:hypothetical protein [Oleiagrimonas sp. C23AA]|uniref:hypothetical protein n=1 Tax=Oleiagrimonas sp. C23AA TaxID=2719047 RepID=UPI00142278BB|nr:hypothetical protein [Oleiagrimonas sp. C23AA]NII11744.1 hypothetical protein [Oleiagrimonas sp. C23AA]